jgi:para-nitrobenzyl esterase
MNPTPKYITLGKTIKRRASMKNKLLALVAIVAIIGIYLWQKPAPQPVVRIASPEAIRDTIAGPIVGFSDEDDTLGWLGIPFAAPPLAELRWAAPRLPKPWQENRQAIAFENACVQLWGPLIGITGNEGEVVGKEDCLYLNVWAPRDNSDIDSAGLPVMFWIHGGGNSIGTANTYPGHRLAGGENVVLVTINYRLGLLGWMSHPALRAEGRSASDASGNYGNLDMIAALEWVQKNIANFGGDPDNVTIFGESAGGLNVYSLMASPPAKGLFHRAIAQSGSTSTTPLWRAENFADDAQPGENLSSREWLSMQLQHAGKAKGRKAAKVAQLAMSDAEILAFMQSRSPQQILKEISGGAGMYRAPQNLRDGTVLPKESLLTLFQSPERYNDVPLMTGTNRDEAKLFMAQDPKFVERRFGFLPHIKDIDAYNSTSAYISDTWKARAVDEVAAVISANSEHEVYAYRWDWDEGAKNWLVDYSTLIGAGHGMEVAFVFDDFEGGILVPGFYNEENSPGRDKLAIEMRSYWSQFAAAGDPANGRNGDLLKWDAWNNSGPNLMILDSPGSGGSKMSREPMTIAMLKQRLAKDPEITDTKTRCRIHAELFLKTNSGDDYWNEQEYLDLGCANYDPWTIIQPASESTN